MFQFDEPFGSSIFCDDIRNEVGGKNSYIGVYPASLAVPVFPASVPKFGVVTTIYEPRLMAEKRDWEISISVYLPGDNPEQPSLSGSLPPIPRETFQMMDQTMLPADDEVPPLVIMNAAFIFTPMILRQPGRIKVRAKYKEGIVLKLGTCRVEVTRPDAVVTTVSSP